MTIGIEIEAEGKMPYLIRSLSSNFDKGWKYSHSFFKSARYGIDGTVDKYYSVLKKKVKYTVDKDNENPVNKLPIGHLKKLYLKHNMDKYYYDSILLHLLYLLT